LALTPEGDLTAGTLRFHKPRAFQAGREVACRYEVRGHRVSFALGAYDHAQPLTIDPVLSFSTFLAGNDADFAVATALDGAGNLYVVGTTRSLNIPGTPGTIQPAPHGGARQQRLG
jgi:hypothetical protein